MMTGFCFGAKRLLGNHVDGAKLAVALGIGLDIVCHCLAFVERLKAFAGDCGEVYKNIIAALGIGNKAEALL